MIFTELPKDSESDTGKGNKFVFSKRFTGINEELNFNKYSFKTSNDYEVVENNNNVSLAINTELRSKTNELIPTKQIFITKEDKELREIPIAISLKNSIMDSPFYNKYLNDENLNQEQTIAVLAISDGKILPLHYSDSRNDNMQLFRIKLGKTILIRPRIELDNLYDGQKVSFFVIPYPYENLDDLLGTYKATNWSTLISETVNINME